MLERLPVWIDAYSLARTGTSLRGDLELSALKRLRPLLCNDEGRVQVDLQLDVDPGNTSYMVGTIQAQVKLICQRCLEPVTLDIKQTLKLGLVQEGRESQLPESYEPLVVGKDPVKLADIIEDEVILAIPAVPMHPEGEDCQPPGGSPERMGGQPELPAAEHDTAEAPQRENPFAVLEALKRKTD